MSITRKKFEELLADFHENQETYLQEREEHSARGHRHPYCFHGTSMWVDYDPMCNGCEESHPDEYTTPEEARKFFNEWYGTDYDGDDLLGSFFPIEWGIDQVEVVKIHHYEAWGVKDEHSNFSFLQAFCTLALVSDGTEFDLVIDASDLIVSDQALLKAMEAVR